MFFDAMLRLLRSEHQNILPFKDGTFRLEWVERTGVDPTDFIECRYHVKKPDDIEKVHEQIRLVAARKRVEK